MAGRSSSSFSYEWTYDVFLSFRGEDTRMGFTSHLYDALTRCGIRTFVDIELLQRGQAIAPTLLNKIQQSRIALILFSKNYAFSSWCLDELAAILECFKEKGRLVLPVFYDVDPSDVRHQRGSYGEAFARHEERFKDDMDKVNKWRIALNQAANLSGFCFNPGHGYEYEFIGRIVKEVSSKITRAPLHIASYPVGLESRVLQVNSLLNVGTYDGVRMVGIYGIGGIGKTTIARAVYNSINDQFEGLCFLDNVREKSNEYGLVHLQQMLLSKIFGDKDINFANVREGISIIKHRLCHKKVLLVLDDVDDIQQLQAIVGGLDWYRSGSIVIITTRDKHLLTHYGVKITYEVKELSEQEALDLLSWNAFKTEKVDPNYADILNRLVTCASRLPLALEVIGSYLFGKSMDEWVDALCQYEKIPDKNIQQILKASFDSLEEDEQTLFLDIACFFNRRKLEDVEYILSAHHGLSVKYSIEMLIEKSFIKIDDGLLTLHDSIQEMGREIVRRESPNEPGRRSRLWSFEDVVKILAGNAGSSSIESLILDSPKDEVHSNGIEGEVVDWDGEAFKKMENLKTLIIRNIHFSKAPSHLPHSLRVLIWSGYPSTSLPFDFRPKKLAILMLPNSFLTLRVPIQRFVHLTVLNFDNCESITLIPDVSGLPNLEELSFQGCGNLTRIHESVGFLDKLRILNAASCNKLRSFPPIRLPSLEQLNLSLCSILKNFPEILGKMENITELHLLGSPEIELPFSIRNLTRLRELRLESCGTVQLPNSIVMMSELSMMHVSRCEKLWLSCQDESEEMVSMSSNTERLILSHCNISDEFPMIDLTWFANVKDLNLSGNIFTMLPACIKECHFLRDLTLDDCRSLRKIRGIPWKLETLSAKGCTSLEYIDLIILPASPEECHPLRELTLDDCTCLQEIRGFLPNLEHFSAKDCTLLTSWCTSMLLNQEPLEAGNKVFFIPGTQIPEWFTHCLRGGSISFQFRNKFPPVSLCLVVGLVDEHLTVVKFSPVPIVLINGEQQFFANRKVYEFRITTDHIFLFDLREDNVDFVFKENKWNDVHVSYEGIDLVAKQIGIHVFNGTSSMEDIRFTSPCYKKRKSPPYHEKKKTSLYHNKNSKKRKPHDLLLMTESVEGSCQGLETIATRPQKAPAGMTYSHFLTSSQPSPFLAGKSQAYLETNILERLCDIGASGCLAEVEAHPAGIQNDPPINEECIGSDDEQAGMSFSKLESEESSSNSKGSESDDPFNQVNLKLGFTGKQSISSGVSSGHASLTSVRGAMDAFELVLVKDISEVYSDPGTQSQLGHLLDLLSTSSHPNVTREVKKALAEFKRKAIALFQEFEDTVESVNKLKDFEKQRTRIQQEAIAGKDRRKELKSNIKKALSTIKAQHSRKEELEAEVATLRKQLATKERDLEQLVLNVKNQEATLSTCTADCASLDEQARVLLKEAVDLVDANTGVEDEGKIAELNQNRLKSTWSTDLTSQFFKIRKKVLRPL